MKKKSFDFGILESFGLLPLTKFNTKNALFNVGLILESAIYDSKS